MHTDLEQLENNEAVLLMYVADELAAEDRAEVEQLLATDAQMRAELERLRATVADVNVLVGVADAHGRLPVSTSVAVRGAMRAMRQWRLGHPDRPVVVAPPGGLRYPLWYYPSAAAAMLALVTIVWWGFRNDPVPGGRIVRYDPPSLQHQGTYVQAVEDVPPLYALADPLDLAYMEIRSIEESADGL